MKSAGTSMSTPYLPISPHHNAALITTNTLHDLTNSLKSIAEGSSARQNKNLDHDIYRTNKNSAVNTLLGTHRQ